MWKTNYSILCKISGRHFEKSILHPHVIRHTLLHPHVIRIRLLHPWEIWLVAFRIYHICKIKHILSKYMIKKIITISPTSNICSKRFLVLVTITYLFKNVKISYNKQRNSKLKYNQMIVQLYRGQVYWWRKPRYPEKTKPLQHIMLYRVHLDHGRNTLLHRWWCFKVVIYLFPHWYLHTFLSLSWYMCWWIISLWGYNSPNSRCFGFEILLIKYYYWNLLFPNNANIF